MSPLGIVTCTVELPSDAEAVGESDVDTLESSGRRYAEPDEIEEPEVDDVVSVEAAFLEAELIACRSGSTSRRCAHSTGGRPRSRWS